MELSFKQVQLLFGNLVFAEKVCNSSLEGLFVLQLEGQVVDPECQVGLPLIRHSSLCGQTSELAKLTLNDLIQLDLSPLIHVELLLRAILLGLLECGFFFCKGFGQSLFELESCFVEFAIFHPEFQQARLQVFIAEHQLVLALRQVGHFRA